MRLIALALTALAPLPVLVLPLLVQPALAQDLMGAEAFDSYTRGKTLSFSWQGREFGREQYLPGRRVVWAFSGDECRKGSWYPQGDHICFVYDDDPTPKCWTFQLGSDGLHATFEDGAQGSDLAEVEQSPTPLACPGPDLGV